MPIPILHLDFSVLVRSTIGATSPEVMADEWEDRIDTVTRGLLGLTVACARCHDHKYDPISTSDYYASGRRVRKHRNVQPSAQ